MDFEIRPASASDEEWIRNFGTLTRRPARQTIRWCECFVAQVGRERVGCSAVERVAEGGYLYGLSVHPNYRRSGIGLALTQVRVERVQAWNGRFAAALVMFWNLRFFYSLGFKNVPKASLPEALTQLPDFRRPDLRRSTAVLRLLKPTGEVNDDNAGRSQQPI